MSVEVDPRVARTREVVLGATVDLLAEVGFDRISIDAIADRSGVARSTIYRNWPERATLLIEAFRHICAEQPNDLPPADCLADDLRALGHLLIRHLASEEWNRSVPTLIGAASHDEQMRTLAQGFHRERRLQARALIERAVERGEVTRPEQIDSALERFIAPFFLRQLMSGQPLDDEFVTAQITATLDQLGVDA